jgi:ribbon-helix-helix CopG family protein
LSVSIAESDHHELELIAAEKKVSVAWVIRDAVELYLAERNPLFGKQRNK